MNTKTLTPILHILEKKLKQGRYRHTTKSITKQEAIKILEAHIKTGSSLTTKAAKLKATILVNKIYNKITQEKPLPIYRSRKYRPTPRRFKSVKQKTRTRRRQRGKRTV